MKHQREPGAHGRARDAARICEFRFAERRVQFRKTASSTSRIGEFVIGIEVKSAISFSAKQFRSLARLRDRLGTRFIAGVVLNTGANGYRYADRLYGAPVSALWGFLAPGDVS